MPILNPELTIILKPEMLTMAETARIDAFTKFECGLGVTLEHNVHIASFSHLNIGGGRLLICEGAAVASGGKVITGSNMLDAESCSAVVDATQQRIERWDVTLGKNSTIFAGGIAMSSLGEGACLAANGFLPRNCPIPPYEIWGGTPARKIGVRNTRHVRVNIKWEEYFSWHCRVYKARPDVRPMLVTELVIESTPRDGFIDVWGKSFDKHDRTIRMPQEFVEVVNG